MSCYPETPSHFVSESYADRLNASQAATLFGHRRVLSDQFDAKPARPSFRTPRARNLTDQVDGFLREKKFLILDNDALCTKQFVRILKDAGTKVVHTAIQAPDMNAIAERFVGSVKRECLSKLILFGDCLLQRVLSNYADHYNQDRPHQSLDNNPIQPRLGDPPTDGEIVVDERLGGTLRSYRRSA